MLLADAIRLAVRDMRSGEQRQRKHEKRSSIHQVQKRKDRMTRQTDKCCKSAAPERNDREAERTVDTTAYVSFVMRTLNFKQLRAMRRTANSYVPYMQA